LKVDYNQEKEVREVPNNTRNLMEMEKGLHLKVDGASTTNIAMREALI
jgi:hypothetical protein